LRQGTHLTWDNTDIIKKNTGTLIDASKEFSLEVNAKKTKSNLLSHHQMQGKIMAYRQQTDLLKMWHSSNI
jgi:hypothetical protein